MQSEINHNDDASTGSFNFLKSIENMPDLYYIIIIIINLFEPDLTPISFKNKVDIHQIKFNVI
jgi:hypothetical protein